MTLTLAIQTALSGLNAAQTGLGIVSDNISNANTEGFTRKQLSISSIVLAGAGRGVRVDDIVRQVDENILRQLRSQGSRTGQYQIRQEFTQQVQDYFGTPENNNSVSHRIASLGAAFEALSLQPEDSSSRIALVSEARFLTGQINELSKDIQVLRADADRRMGLMIDDVNTALQHLADINFEVTRLRSIDLPTAGVEDDRDRLLQQIAEVLEIRTFTRPNGQIVVTAGSGRVLVDGTQANTLVHGPALGLQASNTYIDPSYTNYYQTGGVTGIFVGSATAANDITSEISDGKLRGLIDQRDTVLAGLQFELDELTRALRDGLNAAHNNGVAFPPPTTLTSSHAFDPGGGDVLGGSGTVRIAVVNRQTGAAVNSADIAINPGDDLTTIVANINAALGAGTAAITASGKLQLTAPAGPPDQGIAINEGTSSFTVGAETRGFSHFFGLNDFFVNGTNYAAFESAPQAKTDTFTGTLTFNQAGFGAPVTLNPAGATIEDIADAINADGTLTGAGISASLVIDSNGVRLRIIDGEGDHISLSGTIATALNLRENVIGGSASIGVQPDILDDPSLLASGDIPDLATAIGAGDIVVGSADGSTAQVIGQMFAQTTSFTASGQLPPLTVTLTEYATEILSLNAVQASRAESEYEFEQTLLDQIAFRNGAISGVNVDEELTKLIQLENSYAASSRLITVANDMFDQLLNTI